MSSGAAGTRRSTVRIATRRSALALAQTKLIVDGLRATSDVEVEIIPITTKGDAQADRSLTAIGGDGVFVKELMQALLDERADIAVHSAKDLPTSLPQELVAGAVPQREDARDALVSRAVYTDISTLPSGAVVGTSSLRRAAQLRLLRNDLRIAALRGNVDTRIGKVQSGDLDAAILALAGLKRLGPARPIGAVAISPQVMVPAVGQGALYCQCRAADDRVRSLLSPLNHKPSELATDLERLFLAAVGGGCVAPIGAHAQVDGSTFKLTAVIASTDGAASVRQSIHGPCTDAADARAAVEAVASEMLAAGGREIIEAAKQRNPSVR